MTGLWGGIAVLTLLAVGFVFWPLFRARKLQQVEQAEDRKHQNIDIFRERVEELEAELNSGSLELAEFDELKLELEKNLLNDAAVEEEQVAPLKLTSGTAVTVTLIAMIMTTAAFGLYGKLGRSVDLELALNAEQGLQQNQQPSIEDALAMLEAELKQRPDNAEGWYMLGTTYVGMKRYDEGLAALRKSIELLPEDAPQYAGVMGQYAQALYFASGNKVTQEVRDQIDRTLALEPFEITTLGLLGIDAFEQQNYQGAIDYWSKALVNADGDAAKSLKSGIQTARGRLEARGVAASEAEVTADAAAAQIRVQLSIDESLKAQVNPEHVVFVFARPVGGRMPLAAVRLQVSQLPLEVVLDDSTAMSPQAKLSQQTEVEVTARVSLSGQPQASSGDLYGTLSPVQVGADNNELTLVIDRVVD
ncbi:c-type cytochrome biogenesis protein CcmI [Pontibacterium granulatum]|uniref:c-type cytochrome biogenesis protein CcmI n=1 Tax=Pontibacterium granulatum TaxID=2036029 RepID=UPI00249C24F6|nr:c-type cytochrome biogenesis protein CcmI [Pontibacterium granulatum]MDI3322852.1 c-type cytochrome biogenesis protein CcmI [Pontibacterium granulatum]